MRYLPVMRSNLLALALLTTLPALGCGDPTVAQPDAVQPGTDAAPAGLVQITVQRDSGPVANQRVAFLNADNSLVAMKMTDTSGIATAEMIPGGSVTAELLTPGGVYDAQVYTFEGVKPGDKLVTDSGLYGLQWSDVEVRIPALPLRSFVQIQTSCGDQVSFENTPYTYRVTLPCATTDVFVRAQSPGGADLGQFYVENVAVVGNTIDVSAQVFQPTQHVALTMTNIPPYVSRIETESWVRTRSMLLQSLKAQLLFTSPSPMRSTPIAMPIGTGDAILATRLTRGFDAFQTIVDRTAFGDIALDVKAALIPWVLTRPALDTGVGEYSWTESADGSADGMRLTLDTQRPATANAEKLRWLHYFVAPYAANRLRVPKLPGELAKYHVVSSDINMQGFGGLSLIKLPGGYDALREAPFPLEMPKVTAARGRYVFSSYPM